MLKIPFNPIERAKEVENIVCKNDKRKYYRFRFSRYYGGIVTADTIGCCFLCAYCWNYFRNLEPEKFGNFYSSKEVAEKLLEISKKKNCYKIRISGAEPLLGEKTLNHLINILEILKNYKIDFILETNGLILGYYDFIDFLKPYKNFLYIRISIKGYDEKSFEKITGAEGKYWKYQILALKKLIENEFVAWPAIMYETFKGKGIEMLAEKLKSLNIKPEEIEIEYLEKYPFVIKNLKERNIEI